MIDTATRQDLADAFDKARSKTADTVDTATSAASRAFDESKARAQDYREQWADVVADKAALAGDRLGEAYDDIAQGAARSIRKTAARLESGDLEELGEAVKKFVRKNPALTLGVAAVVGYLAYRRLRKPAPAVEPADEDAETA